MAVQAKIRFRQGVTDGGPGVALVGALTTTVTASNAGIGDLPIQYIWTWIDVPPTSAIPRGEILRGNFSSVQFSPDVAGDYHLELRVFNQGGQSSVDRRVFRVNRATGRAIPAFDAEAPALNFDAGGGNLNARGWAPDMEVWLNFLDSLSPTGTLPGGSLGQFQYFGAGTVFSGATGLLYDGTNNRPSMPNGWEMQSGGFTTRWTTSPGTSNKTITFQNATGTVVLLDTVDTLTNKTIDSPTITGTPSFSDTRNEFAPDGPSGSALVFSQTNKLQTTNATQATLSTVSVPAATYGDGNITVTAEVTCWYAGGGANFIKKAFFKRVSGTLTLVNIADHTDTTFTYGTATGGIDIVVVDNDTIG